MTPRMAEGITKKRNSRPVVLAIPVGFYIPPVD
jgi:hypothetical protein